MLPTMEEMAKEVNLAIKTLKDGTLPTPTPEPEPDPDPEVDQNATS